MLDYLENTKAAFDNASISFDEDDLNNPILQWMRKAVHNIYLKNFTSGSRLLELNAGTGIDAVYLSKHGMKILATDISPKMLEVLELKIKKESLQDKIQVLEKPFDRICEIDEDNFNGVISNFGGLNCSPEFSKLSHDLHKKLRPGGKFIAVIINKFCPWEIFYYLLKFDKKTSLRRFAKGGLDANLNGETIRTFYFTPKEFAMYFKNEFVIEKIYSHGLYTPPPYLSGVYNKLKPVVKVLMKIDEIIKGVYPLNRFGDHFIIIMRKKQICV